MPRFYFDTDDGQTSMKDVYGIELANADAARAVALRALPDMAQQTLPDGDQQKMAVCVRNESDVSILEVTLSLEVEWKQP